MKEQLARKKKFLKEDIVFSSNKEMQELGFSNISLAWDGKNDTYALFTTYRHVVIPSEEEQLTKGELEHEERKNIVVSDCDVDRIMTANSAIRTEFERQGIDKLTTEKFLSYFYEMWIQRKQQSC